MANSNTTGLTAATTPLAGTELVTITQTNSKKVTVANLTSGRAVGATSFNTETAAAKVTLSGTTLAASGTDAGININLLPKGSDKAVVIGSAEAGEHRALIMNGVAAKATYINFQQSGVDKWLFGQGAATNSNNLEIYNTGGIITIVVDKTTNDIKYSGGNLVQGTAAKGINFTSNTPAAGMTSQLLNWYEEGTWTPSVGGTATYGSANSGRYTRIGRVVHIEGILALTLIGTGSILDISGLPFTAKTGDPNGAVTVAYWANTTSALVYLAGTIPGAGTSVSLRYATAASTSLSFTGVIGNGTRIDFSGSYTI